MLRIIGAQLRRRTGRSIALLLGVLFATTGFTVLTASTATSRLAVEGTVLNHSRGAYDILVRPAGSRTPLEAERGLVRANFMAGEYGGITAEQWRQIAAMDGVEVAAPIAMLGYGTMASRAQVDVRGLVDPTLDRQVIRVSWSWLSDGGLSSAAELSPSMVYVTKNAIVYPDLQPGIDNGLYEDGVRRPRDVCGDKDNWAPYEVAADGTAWPICLPGTWQRPLSTVAQLLPDGRFRQGSLVTDELSASIVMPMVVLAAAVDPQAETALVGLDHAIVKGHYLDTGDTLEPVTELPARTAWQRKASTPASSSPASPTSARVSWAVPSPCRGSRSPAATRTRCWQICWRPRVRARGTFRRWRPTRRTSRRLPTSTWTGHSSS